jgi:hypothetical protein
MARINTPLCANPACYLPGQHLTDCDDQEGHRGCQPAQADDGILLCGVCRRRLGENATAAPGLYDDLGLQLRRTGRGEQTSGSRDRSPGVDTAVVAARDDIASTLRRLARLIHTIRGFALPSTVVEARRVPEWFIGPMPLVTYADTSLRALGPFVARSAEWLAARPDAGQHAADLHRITHGRVWGLAYPVAAETVDIGHCPLTVTYIAEDKSLSEGRCGEKLVWDGQNALITCEACGHSDTIEYWQKAIVGETGGIVDTVTAAAWLSMHWFRPVRPSLVANWASREKLQRLMAEPEYEGAKPKPIRDDRGRQLYRLADVKACAEKMWGSQPELRPRRRASA